MGHFSPGLGCTSPHLATHYLRLKPHQLGVNFTVSPLPSLAINGEKTNLDSESVLTSYILY